MKYRPTRFHVALLLLLLAQLYSLATGFAVFSGLTYLLAAALISAFVWSRLSLRGVRVDVRWTTSRARVGDSLAGWLEVTNDSRFSKPFLEVRELTTVPGLHTGRVVSLEAHVVQGWRSRVVARRRGVFTVGPVEVAAGDPFGVFRHVLSFSEPHEVLVYPASEPLPGFQPLMLGVPGEGSRQRTSLQATPSVSHIREYLPGDGLGKIHWPTTARTGTLMVKQFDQEVGNDLWVLLDLDGREQVGVGENGTEEHAVLAAASVADRALGLGVPVGLIASGAEPHHIPANRGPDQLFRILDALARVRAGGDRSLAATLESDQARRRRGNLLIITPSMDPGWARSLGGRMGAPSRVVAALLDPVSFGGEAPVEPMVSLLAESGIQSYVLRRGASLAEVFTSRPPRGVSAGSARGTGAWS